jgi:membrane fusion protein (multidrug efflux system)
MLAVSAAILVLHPEWVKPHAAAEEDAEGKIETEVPVHVAKAKRRSLRKFVEGYGNVAPEPAHDKLPSASARIASPSAGVLSEGRCAEGQKVEKGDTLFQLDTRMAAAEAMKASAARASAKSTLDRLSASAVFAERELERTKRLAADRLASEKDLAEAELLVSNAHKEMAEAAAKVAEADRSAHAADTQAALLRIQSPLSGTVVKVNVSPGEAVEASTVLAEIIDLDRLVIAATIPASQLPSLSIGQDVEILLGGVDAAAPKEELDKSDDKKDEKKDGKKEEPEDDKGASPLVGKLTFLGFQVDTRSDTVAVRVAIPKDAGLRPGQYVRVRVAIAAHKDKLTVPIKSLIRDDEGTFVAIVTGDKAERKPVKVGISEGEIVEVEGPELNEGTVVVTAGAYGLPKSTKVRVLDE